MPGLQGQRSGATIPVVFREDFQKKLTRRASKNSNLKAVVPQWSRTRKRYERQGILLETNAIELAEAECVADADQRRKYSGRVGRSAEVKRLDPEAVRLATVAAIRHQFTNYDAHMSLPASCNLANGNSFL